MVSLTSSQLGFSITMLFMFSTFYTLAFYFHQGESSTFDVSAQEDKDKTSFQGSKPTDTSILSGIVDSIFGVFDWILEALSWFSFFAPLKAMLILAMAGTPELYTALNLLLLRPVGWIGTYITSEWVLNYIRGRSNA